jgi:hypothetical protein
MKILRPNHCAQVGAELVSARVLRQLLVPFAAASISCVLLLNPLSAATVTSGLLQTLHRHVILTSTVSDDGDSNPYAVVVAPVSSGKIHAGDVLVDNFNNVTNLQGTGTTIVDYSPITKKTTVLAKLMQQLPQCPGGVGMTAAMAMLKTGWIIVGSTPSTDGSTRTKGAGGLLVLDSNGNLVDTWTGPAINGPWGNVALVDNGSTATLFVSMAGFDVTAPSEIDPRTGYPVVIKKATVLRLDLSIQDGKPPVIVSQTVIADGFGERADKDAFLIGPTGLALGPDDTLYVSDALTNRIAGVQNASTRADSAGLGQTVSQGGLLEHPLALVCLPNGHLLTNNARNGQVVEIDPVAGKQLYAQWIDTDQAQSPPGNGDLFGIALTPDGQGFYYVEDDMNTLMEAKR